MLHKQSGAIFSYSHLHTLIVTLAVACIGIAGPAAADDGTGFDTDGTWDFLMAYFGDDPYKDHQDFVEDNGPETCFSCHELNGIGYTNGFAPGCLTCHEPQWEEEDYAHLPAVRSFWVMFHDAIFGADSWPVEDHPDYVEDNGTGQCSACHSLDAGGYGNPPGLPGPGCLSCHDVEWDDDEDEEEEEEEEEEEDDDDEEEDDD
ncbi:MAG: hypothetical protein OEQ14_19105 [Gammaproteobacteria bacterium]|nr:hypothetical protein [Gammaproteobacteria bacterium]